MMQKIQRFGGAMFVPVLLFPFAGIIVGLATLCELPATYACLEVGASRVIVSNNHTK